MRTSQQLTGFKMPRESSFGGKRGDKRKPVSLSGREDWAGGGSYGNHMTLDRFGLWSLSSVRQRTLFAETAANIQKALLSD